MKIPFLSAFHPLTLALTLFLLNLMAAGTIYLVSGHHSEIASSLPPSKRIEEEHIGSVLAESTLPEDFLITFNFDTMFVRPAEFISGITAPNVIYDISPGTGIGITGDPQSPVITNTGLLSLSGARGAVTLEEGDNVTIETSGNTITISSTDTDTDTKLSETEVEEYAFDGDNTGTLQRLKIGSIWLDDDGTSAVTSGASLIGVYQGNLTTVTGTTLQEILEDIDTELGSGAGHVAVTLAGIPTYLTISGQQITMGYIDLSSDITGVLPIANGGTGSNNQSGARTNLGIGTSDTVQFGGLRIGGEMRLFHCDDRKLSIWYLQP